MPIRPELDALPLRLQALPLDARGYPVPWFVQWLAPTPEGGVTEVDAGAPGSYPEFRVMDGRKWRQAVQEHRCWVCGGSLGVFKTFVLGPMCGINRTTAEPPCHRDCALWSAKNCPFLARPQMVRRQAEDLHATLGTGSIGGTAITRNPGVALVWTTKTYRVWAPKPGERLIEVGDPTEVQWFAEGRPATRAEVEHSVAGGLPALLAMAEAQDREEPGAHAVQALTHMVAAFAEAHYPAALQ